MNKTELKQAVTKIKKFLKQKDYAAIDTGSLRPRPLGLCANPAAELAALSWESLWAPLVGAHK